LHCSKIAHITLNVCAHYIGKQEAHPEMRLWTWTFLWWRRTSTTKYSHI